MCIRDSYKLTSLYGIAHGHAVALCLPQVWRYTLNHMDKLQEGLALSHLQEALEIYKTVLVGENNDIKAIEQFEFILDYFEMEIPELRSPEELDILTSSVNPVRLKNNPVVLDKEAIREIYKIILGLQPPDGSDKTTRERLQARKELHELQNEMLEILAYFDEFCTKNNLQYYLSEGSLLGAIRHRGFIPWDDDVDVMMPREDYDRFIQMAPKKYSSKYYLDCFETNPKHWVLGAKIQKTTPSKFYQEKTEGLAKYPGPYIDIFPLDYLPKAQGFRTKYQMRKMRALRRMNWIKTGFSLKMAGQWQRYLLRVICKVVSLKSIHHSIDKTMKRFNQKEKAYYINYCSYYALEKQVFPRSYYGKGIRAPFEGYSFLVPNQSDSILRSVYGVNYLNVPVLKRQQRHGFSVNREFKQTT